jgi:PAS domain S-box-containing protein
MGNMATQLLVLPDNIANGENKNVYPAMSITEIIGNGFFIVDRQWTVKYWNKKAEKLLNVRAKDITGKNLWEQFSEILPVNFYANYHRAFLQDIPVRFEEYWEEMEAWFDVVTWHSDDSLFVSFKSNSYPVLMSQSAKDLKIINDLYRFVTEITNDCLWEWNFHTNELFWIDGGHKRAFGYSIENSLIPQSFWESCLHVQDRERVLARLKKTTAEGSTTLWEDEYRFKKANGDYAFVHDRGHIIYEDGKASRMVGATQDITERILLENKLKEERQQRQREITEAILTTQEKERAAIGIELQDNLCQILAAAKMYMQMAKNNHNKRAIYLKKSGEFVQDVIAEIRKISKKLVIPGTNIIGLCDNIKNLIHDLVLVNPIKIEFQATDICEEILDEKLQLTIFRIVQEQVNNILKHANATHATVRLSRQGNEIILLISDNGKGCDIEKEKKAVEIINIRSRAELHYGRIAIASKPEEGFELKVVLPLIAA